MRAIAVRSAVSVSPPLRRLVEQRAELVETRSELKRVQHEIDELRRRRDDFSDLRYVFIVTYGRSGSTLLQGVLNTIPGWIIRGEHRDALNWLVKYHHALLHERDEHTAPRPLTPKSPWYGIDRYDEVAAVIGMRNLVVSSLLRPDRDTRVVGFKEIRWEHQDWQRYVTFLRTLFPGARFIINTRSKEAVLKSKWWAANPDAEEHFDRSVKRLDDIKAFLGDAAYSVHFDDWVSDTEVLAGLFDWLGEPFDRDAVGAVMSEQHSF